MEQISMERSGMDICSISGAARSGGWNERFIVPFSFNSRRESSIRRAYPAVIPIAHIIPPDHCFQLSYRIIFRLSVSAVKQFFLHSCPHTFASGVIVTSASGTVHALNKSGVFQHFPVLFACILAASVRMQNCTFQFRIGFDRIFYCFSDEAELHR